MDNNLILSTPPPSTREHESPPSQTASRTDIVPAQRHSPFLPPLPAAASLSLAFSSMLSSSLLISRFGASPLAFTPLRQHQSLKKNARPRSIVPAITAAAGVEISFPSESVASRKALKKYITAFPDYFRLPEKHNYYGDPSNGGALRRVSVVWFRNDLRVHDNEALSAANDESLSILPVYCFDPRDYGKSSSGFDKTGPYRAKFLLECVSDLRENLKARGSDLVIRIGKPEEILLSLAKDVGADGVYAHLEISANDIQSEDHVTASLKEEGIETKYFWGSTMFHLDDLPFTLEEMPTTYSSFHERVQNVNVRATISAPSQLKGIPVRGGVKPGDIPTLQELGINPSSLQRQNGQTRHGPALVGGETEALQRLERFANEHLNQVNDRSDKHSSGDSMFGANFSCKISPWLATGCLSPRRMHGDLTKRGKSVVSASLETDPNKGLSWLVYELLWRDFFRFITKKYGSSQKSSDMAPVTACMAAV